MNSKTTVSPVVISAVFVAALFVMLLAMRATNEILAPILLALVLAVCTTPILDWFKSKGAPSWLALVLTIVLLVVFIVVTVLMVGESVQNLATSLSEYEYRLAEIEQSLGGLVDKLGVDTDAMAAGGPVDPVGLVQLAAGLVAGLVSGISNLALVLVVAVYFVVEASSMPRKVKSVTEESDPEVQQMVSLFAGLRQYVVINAGVGALAAVINTIMLAAVGVEGAVLWGVLSFFFSFVPSVGFFFSVIPPAILALIQFGWETALFVFAAYVVINFLVDSIIKPVFVQEGVNISVTVTFLSLVVWGWVLGPIGAILAVPMAIIVQAIFAGREETRWVAYMMGSGSEPFMQEAEPDRNVLEQDVV